MTDRQPRPTDWPDDRLTEAFGARAAAHLTPGDLPSATVDRLRATPRGSTSRRRLALVGGLAAAAAVVAIAIALIAGPSADQTGDTTEAFGLRILTVSQAIEVRDRGFDDRELAVAGFLTGPAPLSCPFDPAPPNPTDLRCPEATTWLMAAPESLITRTETSMEGRGPTGPALHPSFAGVDRPPGHPLPARGGSTPTAVVLVGHFDDRRSKLCPAEAAAACADTFIVDRVDSVEGSVMARSVRLDLDPYDGGPTRVPTWTSDEVIERLRAVFPRLEPLSVVALPGKRIGELEPSLGTGVLGIIDRPIAWIVTGLDARAAAGDPPVRRTFLLVDGTAEAYESVPWDVSNVGFVPFTLVGTSLPGDTPAATSSPSPVSVDFPTKVLDLGVASVGKALELHPQFDDAELAISGWYVSPDPAATCPGLRDQIRPVRPPCNEGRAWLLEQPEDLWSDPRKTGIDRQPSGPYLNPIVPSDVAFDLPNQWSAESPELLPVVVVGHFADPRVTDTYAGNAYFVVDQVVWAAGDYMPNRAVRLVSDTVESGADVMARIDRALGPSNTTWTSLVRGSDLSVLDPGAADAAPELMEAATVWVVRRLVMAESDGATRLVMETAFTPDRSERVWSRRGCCGLELATTIDVQLPPAGGGGGLVEIADRTGTVVSARIVAAGSYTDWRPVGPKEGWWIEVAAGDSPRELAIRWTADRCETTWRLTVEQGPWLDLTRPFVEGCDARTGAQRAIVVTFDHPIDINDVRANDNTSGG